MNHTDAESLCRQFAAGERVSQSQAREAVALLLQTFDYRTRAASWQRCDTHGAIDGSVEWACPRCFLEMKPST